MSNVIVRRSCGILLHPTSLPGRYGIGDLGPAAHAWVEWLAQARQSWWQILPLQPTGAGDSPYQALSATAGNPLLLSPDLLVRDGLLIADDVGAAVLPDGPVDYGAVIRTKGGLLARAWERFQAGAGKPELHSAYEEFLSRAAGWLYDCALFLALKEEQGGGSWFDWPEDLRLRRPAALEASRRRLHAAIGRVQFGQFLFDRQWRSLKAFAHAHGVHLIGDLPIFVAGDSVDVWANPELFQLDRQRRPTVVAGVPPDYFSASGQLWGNPHYDWPAHAATGYAWWRARLRATLEHVDLVRLDHFRGFAAAWQVQAGQLTAELGQWVPGPGAALFEALAADLGGLPLIAEDLGVITADVDTLRRHFDLPGMRILQFAFGRMSEERFLPHNYECNTVVYTGTHDNDTTIGWFAEQDPATVRDVRCYLPAVEDNIAWDLLRTAWASVAELAVAPLQDVLALPTAARMNYPGRAEGNWRWRCLEQALTDILAAKLAERTQVYRRATV
jgi:4-alpha-glucanotransferase